MILKLNGYNMKNDANAAASVIQNADDFNNLRNPIILKIRDSKG